MLVMLTVEGGGCCESRHYRDLHRAVSPHSIHDPLPTCAGPSFAHAFSFLAHVLLLE